MKIALLTVHCSTNYGASLQAYALKKYIENWGYTVEIINYRYDGFLDLIEKDNLKISERIKKIVFYKKYKKRHDAFNSFENIYLNIDRNIYKHKDELMVLNGKYDLFVVGSDQVWNPKHINYDDTFFFSMINDGIKVSYAASIGKTELEEKEIDFLKENIANMHHIGIREAESSKFVSDLCDIKNVMTNIDPVFLFDRYWWQKIEKEVKLPFDNYCLVYVLGDDNKQLLYEILPEIKRNGEKIVCIQGELRNRHGDMNFYGIGPCEFIYLVNHAKHIITNSFHGIAFSIIFGKKFIPLSRSVCNIRLENILQLLELDDLLIKSKSEYDSKKWTELWEKVSFSYNKIADECAKSKKYFEEIFNNLI